VRAKTGTDLLPLSSKKRRFGRMIYGGIEVNKYYFITYITRKLGKQYLESDVIDEHPFNWLKRSSIGNQHTIVLAGWQEISYEEYGMFDNNRMSNLIGPKTTKVDLNRLEESGPSDQDGLKS
jgi:hypothetical protein